MLSGRLVLAVLAVLCGTLTAQSPSVFTLSVKVMDTSGACISNATVQARSAATDSILLETKTYTNGVAELNLEPVAYSIRVSALGFKTTNIKQQLLLNGAHSILAVLEVGNSCSPCLVIGDPILFETERQNLDAAIAPLPLVPLPNLPAHKFHPTKQSHR
jgi:hypothetical protein